MQAVQQRILAALSKSPDFQGFAPQELREISAICRLVQFAAGAEVFTIDHSGKSVFIVASGKLRLRLKTRRIKEYSAGELFGEIAVLSNRGRLGTIQCLEDAELVVIDKERIFQSDLLSLTTRLNLIMALTQKMISYFYQQEPAATERIRQHSPSETLSFVESLDAKNERTVIQTIAAFLNQRGGTLLIGLSANGQLSGLELSKGSADALRGSLRDQFTKQLDASVVELIHFDVDTIDEQPIIRIDVDPAERPVFYTNPQTGEERFIVRMGDQNNLLQREQQIDAFVGRRFSAEGDLR